MNDRHPFAAVCVLTSLLAACAPPDDAAPPPDSLGDIEGGHITGSILFTNPPGPVATHIASQTVGYPSDPWVTAMHVNDPTVTAAGVYGPPSASDASAAYSLAVPLGTPGTSAFRLMVDMLEFEPNPASPVSWLPIGVAEEDDEDQQLSGPRYRFGSTQPGATTAHIATLTDGAAERDIAECAALVNMRVRLVGDDADLDALDASPGSIVCSVRAVFEDVAFSGDFHPQAFSDLVVTDLATVRGAGVVVPILVRGDGSRIRLEVGCAAHTVAPGFPLPPELPDGWTMMGTQVLGLATDPVECDEVVEVDADIGVERTAGAMRGLFDVVGADESHQGVRITTAAGYDLIPPTAIASELLDDSDPADYWEFEGVPAGPHTFRAWAVLDGGTATIETPYTEQQNGQVNVAPGVTTNLRARFVAQPHVVSGTIEIVDPVPSDMDFRLLQNAPFNSMNRFLHSHVQARGRNVLSALPNGASGVNGRARGLLAGTFDEVSRTATLEYAIPLTGLGPIDGALDGSDAFPTPWNVDRILLYLRGVLPSDSSQTLYQRVDIEPGYNLVFDAQAGHPDTIPTMPMCFGHVGLELRLAPGIGTLYEPRMWIGNSPLSATTQIQPPAYSRVAYGEVIGAPSQSAQAATVGRVEAVLPEGIQYAVQPALKLISTDGTESELTLSELSLPLDGPLECGEASWDCLSVDEEGNLHALGVAIEPSTLCEVDTSLNVVVASDLDVTSIVVDFYDTGTGAWGSPQTVCSGSCGVSPIEPVTVDLSGGDAYVRVHVEDEFGCTASHAVPVQSYTPLIACPSEIRVVLEPAESTISGTDPRIQPPLATVGLAPGCWDTPAVSHDGPATFELGTTNVTFTAEGAQPCETAVIVVPPVQLAYIEGNTVKLHRVLEGVEYSKSLLEPRAIDFDGEGEYLVVVNTVSGQRAVVLNPETGVDYAESLGLPTFHGPFPGYIHMDARTAGPMGFAVSLVGSMKVLGAGLGAELATNSATLVDFSDDGERLLVATVDRLDGSNMVLKIHEAGTAAFPLTFTELGEITLLAAGPIDLTVSELANGSMRFVIATRSGIYTFDDQLTQVGTVPMPIYSAKFGKKIVTGAAVCLDDGRIGILSELGLKEIPGLLGNHDVAFSPDHNMFAVVRPTDIAIYRWEVGLADPIDESTIEYTLLETIPADNAKYPVFRPGSH